MPYTGSYSDVGILTDEQLKAKPSQFGSLIERSIQKGAKWSLEHDNKPMYVSSTQVRVFLEETPPAFNAKHWRVTGRKVELYTPTYGFEKAENNMEQKSVRKAQIKKRLTAKANVPFVYEMRQLSQELTRLIFEYGDILENVESNSSESERNAIISLREGLQSAEHSRAKLRGAMETLENLYRGGQRGKSASKAMNLSGYRVNVSADQNAPLQVGSLVIEKNDRNPSYLGIVEKLREGEVMDVIVKWLKWGNSDDWRDTCRSVDLIRLTKV